MYIYRYICVRCVFFLSFYVVIDITAYFILLRALAHKRIYLPLLFRFILYYIALSFRPANQKQKAFVPKEKSPINKITHYLSGFVWISKKGDNLLIMFTDFCTPSIFCLSAHRLLLLRRFVKCTCISWKKNDVSTNFKLISDKTLIILFFKKFW